MSYTGTHMHRAVEYATAPPRSEDLGSLAPYIARLGGLPQDLTERRELFRRRGLLDDRDRTGRAATAAATRETR